MGEELEGNSLCHLVLLLCHHGGLHTPLPLTTGSLGSCFQIWECPLQATGPGAGRVRPGVDDSSVPYRPFSPGQVSEPL